MLLYNQVKGRRFPREKTNKWRRKKHENISIKEN
jgi:hypothetical protein